jgi:protein-L-isoaspartate(D-aspartate) O-methyltransferase
VAGRPYVQSESELDAARKALIEEIEGQVARYGTGDGGKVLAPRVLRALGKVPREKFVPMMEQAEAYLNRPLPIGHRQTISQPLIVALMTHHLQIEPTSKILEIGTGSGYQTAVLAELATNIVTIENVAELAEQARSTLTDLGYRQIHFIHGDGRNGDPEHAPFDRIITTAAAETLPKPLLDQLAPAGRLVAPIGKDGQQELMLITKDVEGKTSQRSLFPVAFVPLT